MEKHNIAPVFDENSRILILGSFPSVKSRETNFFYGHPQNRFWKILAALTSYNVPVTVEEKKAMLLKNGIAVWDVIESCDIKGSGDSSIKNVVPNDISRLLKESKIKKIFCNGAAAFKLYEHFCMPKTGIHAVKLPSSSPANAAFNIDKLINEWKIITK